MKPLTYGSILLGLLVICCLPVSAAVTLSVFSPPAVFPGQEGLYYGVGFYAMPKVTYYGIDFDMDPNVDVHNYDCEYRGGNSYWCTGSDTEGIDWDEFVFVGDIRDTTPCNTVLKTCARGEFIDESGFITLPEVCSETRVVCPNPSPEFPSVILPATMIIGFLGAVFLIQRTREH